VTASVEGHFEPNIPGLPDFLQPRPGPGSLSGAPAAFAKLNKDERNFADELVALGNQIEVVDTGGDPTPDSDGLSKSISSTIMEARSQSSRIIIDARGQPGMTREAADQAVKRAYGADLDDRIENITILTPGGPVYAPRQP
jgi:hypothetical protein